MAHDGHVTSRVNLIDRPQHRKQFEDSHLIGLLGSCDLELPQFGLYANG